MPLKTWICSVLTRRSRKPMARLQPKFPLRSVELLEDRNAPATLSVGNVAGDLLITDTAGVVNSLTMSVDSGNLIITDTAEQFDGTGGFAGASLSNGDKTLSIPLTSLAGANVSIDAAADNDMLTINALPGFASGLTIGSPARPLASVTLAGAVSLPAGKNLSVWAGTITVSGAVSTAGGAIGFIARNGITISDAVSSGGGAITLNADSDANGSGTLTLSAASFATWTQQQQITAAGGAANDFVGWCVALSGDGNTAIVGAPFDNVGGNINQGTATIFTRSGGVWTEQQQITGDGGAANDQFGFSVALSSDGNTAIVGASGKDVDGNIDQGMATIFTRSAGVWTQQQQITDATGAADDGFGRSVALSSDGNTAIVGTRLGGNVDQGTATIFTRSDGVWTEQQEITAADGAALDCFGNSVALSSDGNTAIVGAYLDDVGGNIDQGTATIFTRFGSVWTQQQQIAAASGAASDQFGTSVALSSDGNTAIVGAYRDVVGDNTNQGSATIFSRSGSVWTQQQQITAANAEAEEWFGASVAMSGDGNTAIVGAIYGVGGIFHQGTATIFTRSGEVWTQQQQIIAAGGASNDNFGYSVALSINGNTALVGGTRDDVGGNIDQGTATVFTLSPPVIGGSLNAGSGAIAIAAAGVDLRGSVTSSGPVSITVSQNNRPIDLGGSALGSLCLSDAELDLISGGALTIGDATSGALTVSFELTLSTVKDMALISGGIVTVDQPVTVALGTNLTVNGQSITVLAPVNSAGGTLQMTADDGITISDGVSSSSGALTLNADGDANGSGGLTLSAAAFGTWIGQQQISVTSGAANDEFGRCVALSRDGNTAIVGVYLDDVLSGTDRGTATIFTRSGGVWTQQQQITAVGGSAGDRFGTSVALSGDGNTAIVGADGGDVDSNINQGTATIFIRTGSVWTQQQRLAATDGAPNDGFGTSVALSSDGNIAIVGASLDDVSGNSNQGTATIFTRSGGVWTQQQQLTATDGAADDRFGSSVALSSQGNIAIVGAYGDDVGGNIDQGTATIFARSGGIWTQQQQITAAAGAAADQFGISVALSSDGNTAIVGAWLDDVGGNSNQGTATIFTRSGGVWTQQQQINADDGAAGDQFGWSVALSSDGNTAIVGAFGDDVGTKSDQGRATIFTRSGSFWTQRQQISAADGAANDRFGWSVALSGDGNTAIVGAYRDDVGGNTDQGTATIFARSGGAVGGSLNAGTGAVAITAASVDPKHTTANEITAATTTFTSGSDLRIAITGATTFDTLNVAGTANLSGVDLVLTGGYVPVQGDIFTIVSATTRSGFFNNRPDGSTFVFNGVVLRIDYTATAVILTAVSPPTVTSINPVAGPTTGGTLVIITGAGFTGATSVTFGGTNATSYTVLSNTSIQAVTPAHAAGIVDVIVTNNGLNSANTAADNFEYIQSAAAPQFGSFTVNGGDMYAINAYGVKVAALAGNNSIIEQLYVTFDIGVTLGAGAFTLDAGPVTANIPGGVNPVAPGTNVVTIIAEADPATLDGNGGYMGYRLRFSGSATYLNTFDNSPTGNGGEGNIFTTLKDGFYKLNIVGANVHAGSTVAGTPMASDVTQSFWTMFASYAPDDRSISATPGDGSSIISVNSSVINFANANGFGYGTSLTGPSGQAYNANFDWNLDGDVGDDLIEFAKRFGAEWAF